MSEENLEMGMGIRFVGLRSEGDFWMLGVCGRNLRIGLGRVRRVD